MKFIIQLILIVLFTFIGQFIFPWWGLFIMAAIATALVPDTGFKSFIAGFFGVGLLWFVQIYLINDANGSILSSRISTIFGLSSPILLMVISSFVGGLAGGFAALTGKLLRDLFKKNKELYSVYS